MFTNYKQYSLLDNYIDVMVADMTRTPLRVYEMFDAIVTDRMYRALTFLLLTLLDKLLWKHARFDGNYVNYVGCSFKPYTFQMEKGMKLMILTGI